MLYRHEDGTYTASSADGEHSKELTRKEGDAVVMKVALGLGHTKKQVRERLKSRKPGFIVA